VWARPIWLLSVLSDKYDYIFFSKLSLLTKMRQASQSAPHSKRTATEASTPRGVCSETARHWSALEEALPLEGLLLSAERTGALCLVVPWICEMIKMMEWCSPEGLSAPYLAALRKLRKLRYCGQFDLCDHRGKLSGNRWD